MITDEIFYHHFTLVQQENHIYAEWCKKRGISYTWLIILDTMLRSEKEVEPAMLSDMLFIPRQTVTSLLDQLEKNGLIRLETHPADRRRTRLYLTAKGHDTITTILKELAVHEDAVIDEISREEMATFNRIYSTIVEKLHKRLIHDK